VSIINRTSPACRKADTGQPDNKGIVVSHCANCGHPLGLKRPVWWWSIKFCCPVCKTLYKARRWQDVRGGWINFFRFRSLSAQAVRRHFVVRVGAAVATLCFVVLGGTVLIDQWISGHRSALFTVGTAMLIAGLCVGLFALIGLVGLSIAFLLERYELRTHASRETVGTRREFAIGHHDHH
jgi:hypothetical protein